jgi:hypothetical protein
MPVFKEIPHVYQLKVYKRYPTLQRSLLPTGNIKLEGAPDEEEPVALPNPVFLDCHYRVAEILNASGMAEEIELKMREWEDAKATEGGGCLEQDGTTDISQILNAALCVRAVG